MLLALDDTSAPPDEPKKDDSPEARMKRRFPQKVRVGDLLGLEVVDGDNRVFAKVHEVVRTPDQKIKLIVVFDRWLQWFGGRLVAAPIEVVAIVGKQIASMDMEPDDYRKAPTWMASQGTKIPDDEIIRIAITRR
jgi:hypothetical protein